MAQVEPGSESVLVPPHAQEFGRVVFHCVLIGTLAGLAALGFEYLVKVFGKILLLDLAGLSKDESNTWVLASLPAIGGLIGGVLVYGFAPEAAGGGTDAAIDAYHNRQGRIRARIPLIKTLASVTTLVTGGSAGREGPIGLIGAGIGAVVARLMKLSANERRLLMVAGMAAGIGAVFRAPLAAALFSAEILYREMDMEFEVIVPSMISSIVSYSVFEIWSEGEPFLRAPKIGFESVYQLPTYTILAFVVAAGAYTYTRVFRGITIRFERLSIPIVLKPVLGGCLAGSFALICSDALGPGYSLVQDAIDGKAGVITLLTVAAAKTITTSCTVGSGQSGGVFGPGLVIGGALSGAVGLAVTHNFAHLGIAFIPQQGAFVLVGMAGFFAAAANTPISTVIMVSELTRNYQLLIPSMWVCIIAFMLVYRSSLFEKQLNRRTDSPVHLGEMMGDILRQLTVGVALEVGQNERTIVLAPGAGLTEMMEVFSKSHHSSFPVVSGGKLLGLVDNEALRQAICDDVVRDVIVAADLVKAAPTLVGSESLHSAMHKMVSTGNDELAVVAEGDQNHVIGLLSRRTLIGTYDHHMREHRKTYEQETTNPWMLLGLGRVNELETPSPSAGGGGAEGNGEEFSTKRSNS